MKKILEIIKNKWLRKTAFTILLIAIVVAAYMAINLGIQTLDLTDIDLTKQGFYTLSDESKEQLKNITEEINIYIFGYEENSSVVDLAKQYAKYKENITVEVVSVEGRPDLAKEYDITTTDEENYLPIVFACEGRSITATYYDLYTYDYNTYEYIDLTEQKLTNSILAVTLKDSPKAYFLTGHSEYGLTTYFSTLSEVLESEVYEAETLDLLVTTKVPNDCNVLVIATPSTDFTDYETELIIDYINNGGNILWLSDYTNSGTLSNVQKILDLYGITLYNDGIILEQDTSAMLMQTQDVILPTVNSSSEITSVISSSGKVLFLDSGKIEVEDEEKLEELGVAVTELLTTSEKAFYRTDLTNGSSSPTSDEEAKSYIVGALATKTIEPESENETEEEASTETITSELVVYANCIFATDYPIQIENQSAPSIYFYNNQDLVMNSIAYLTERTETITVRKTYSSITYTPTEEEDNVVKLIIFVVPLIIIAVGLIVWRMRRRRR